MPVPPFSGVVLWFKLFLNALKSWALAVWAEAQDRARDAVAWVRAGWARLWRK